MIKKAVPSVVLLLVLLSALGCGTDMNGPVSQSPVSLQVEMRGPSVENLGLKVPPNGQLVNLKLLSLPHIIVNTIGASINIDPVTIPVQCNERSPGFEKNYPLGLTECFYETYSLIPDGTSVVTVAYRNYAGMVKVQAPTLAEHYKNLYVPGVGGAFVRIDPNDKDIKFFGHVQEVTSVGTQKARLVFLDKKNGMQYVILVDRKRTPIPSDNVGIFNFGVLEGTNTLVVFN